MQLSDDQKVRIFDTLYNNYVQEHGLGGISKTDLDSLFVYLIRNETGCSNSFDLSNELKITESRIKSLLERASVKYDKRSVEDAWICLLDILVRIDYDVESLEKGQIRFQLSDPMLYRWLQNSVRELGSTCSYSKSTEQVLINLDTLYSILDLLWEEEHFSKDWSGDLLISVHEKIVVIIGRISKKIEMNLLTDLRNKKQPRLLKFIEVGSNLASIGSFIIPLLQNINK